MKKQFAVTILAGALAFANVAVFEFPALQPLIVAENDFELPATQPLIVAENDFEHPELQRLG